MLPQRQRPINASWFHDLSPYVSTTIYPYVFTIVPPCCFTIVPLIASRLPNSRVPLPMFSRCLTSQNIVFYSISSLKVLPTCSPKDNVRSTRHGFTICLHMFLQLFTLMFSRLSPLVVSRFVSICSYNCFAVSQLTCVPPHVFKMLDPTKHRFLQHL